MGTEERARGRLERESETEGVWALNTEALVRCRRSLEVDEVVFFFSLEEGTFSFLEGEEE